MGNTRAGQARFIFITGLSGSGKTLAAKALEDGGFFCVDNLPPRFIGPFAELTAKGGENIDRIAIVADIRQRGFVNDFPDVFRRLRQRGVGATMVFLEARDDVLVRRFSESRRPHPLARGKGSVLDAVRAERQKLSPIRNLADQILDTSALTVHELRQYLLEQFGEGKQSQTPLINLVSFGYKYGIPLEADLVFDVRFLRNPYFEGKLRNKDGTDPAVERFLLSFPSTGEFLERLRSFVGYLVPQYTSEGKSYLTMGIGCTGGRHRSVMVANAVADFLREKGWVAKVTHRDIDADTDTKE
ncbi:MAG: RNase adapter RapZ [Acidobacteriota bacterium]